MGRRNTSSAEDFNGNLSDNGDGEEYFSSDDDQLLSVDELDVITLTNNADGDIVSAGNPVMDYVCRSDEVFDYSLWSFVSRFDFFNITSFHLLDFLF